MWLIAWEAQFLTSLVPNIDDSILSTIMPSQTVLGKGYPPSCRLILSSSTFHQCLYGITNAV